MSSVPANIYELLTFLLSLGQEWSPVQFSNEDINSAPTHLTSSAGKNGRMSSRPKSCTSSTQDQPDGVQQEIAHARSRGYSFDSDLLAMEQRDAEEVVRRRQRLYNGYTNSRVGDSISEMFS